MYKSETIKESLLAKECQNCNSIEAELTYVLKSSGLKYEKISTNFYVITLLDQKKEKL